MSVYPTRSRVPDPEAREKIREASDKFNRMINTPRIGVTCEDMKLWAFSSRCRPSKEWIADFNLKVDLFKETLLRALESYVEYRMKGLASDIFPFDIVLKLEDTDSPDRAYLNPDGVSIILVLNSTKLLLKKMDSNGAIDHAIDQKCLVRLSSLCDAIVDDFLNDYQSPPRPMIKLIQANGSYLFEGTEDEFSGFRFELFPVLKYAGSWFLRLNGEPFSIGPSTHAINVHNKYYPDLWEMMGVLKLIHKETMMRGLTNAKNVKTATVEQSVMTVLDAHRGDGVWWKKSSFTTIFKAAVNELIKTIQKKGDPSNEELIDHYGGWTEFDECDLLIELEFVFGYVFSK